VIDCGEDWLGKLKALKAHAIVITHPHPDHVIGLKEATIRVSYAIKKAWEKMCGFPDRADQPYSLAIRNVEEIAGVNFEPFAVMHSVRVPEFWHTDYRFQFNAGGVPWQMLIKGAEL